MVSIKSRLLQTVGTDGVNACNRLISLSSCLQAFSCLYSPLKYEVVMIIDMHLLLLKLLVYEILMLRGTRRRTQFDSNKTISLLQTFTLFI